MTKNGYHRTPFATASMDGQAQVVGIAVFAYAYVVTIPSWVRRTILFDLTRPPRTPRPTYMHTRTAPKPPAPATASMSSRGYTPYHSMYADVRNSKNDDVTTSLKVNEKKPDVNVNSAIWIPATVGLFMKIASGLLGAWAYQLTV